MNNFSELLAVAIIRDQVWFEQFNMVQVMTWIILFVALMLLLEHGLIARLEEKVFAWRPIHAL